MDGTLLMLYSIFITSLGRLAHELFIERFGRARGDREPFPLISPHELAGGYIDLPHVEAVVIDLADDRGVDRVLYASDGDDLAEIVIGQ